MKQRLWLLCAIVFLLPAYAFATEENEVIALPTAIPVASITVANTSDYSIESMAGYYGNVSEGINKECYQYPSLTAEEQSRAAALLTAYDNGKRPANSVLNKETDISVGVYDLNPEDYEGETVYVLLPCRDLTDEELLEVIHAYALLGLEFGPASLSYRNCMRGGGVETSRFPAEEERERWTLLMDLYRRQGLRPEQAFTAIPGDDGLGLIALNEDDYSGLDTFTLRPYRYQTDEELLRYVSTFAADEQQAATAEEYSKYENMARQELIRVLNAPLALKRDSEEMSVASQFSIDLDDEKVYVATFSSPTDEVYQYTVLLNVDTGKMTMAWALGATDSLRHSDLRMDPFDEKWQAFARDYVKQHRTDNVAVATVECLGETDIQDVGYGVYFAVTMEDGSYYTFSIAYQNEQVTGVVDYMVHAPKPMTEDDL